MDATKLNLLLLKDADTLAYIDPPPLHHPGALRQVSPVALAHHIHSQNLLETNSPIFHKLLGQKAQIRNVKRRGAPPEGIRYIIDLTPPSTDEDAVSFLTELSCPLGIRIWANGKERWRLPEARVGGIDEPNLPKYCNKPLPDYHESRHRTGILHILQVLEGINPQLDTPCKLWTFFALAKLYGIATLPQVRAPIISWIYDSNNKRLIELYPEVTYRIAKGIQCDYSCWDSFSVLVGEEALLLFRNTIEGSGPKRHERTLHGRAREPMDDEELQRIEYASKSFMDFVIARFINLVGSEMSWLSQLSTFQDIAFSNPQTAEDCAIVSGLLSCLKLFVRGCIVATLDDNSLTWLRSQDIINEDWNDYPTRDFPKTYSSLNLIERIMSRNFWEKLATQRCIKERWTLTLRSEYWGTSIASLGNRLEAFRGQEDAMILPVEMKELRSRVDDFNALFHHSALKTTSNISTYEHISSIVPSKHLVQRQFNLNLFFDEAHKFLNVYASDMTSPSRLAMTYDITDTLTCLTDDELKYLPLWAGGNDDTSGGVFADQNIPFLEAGGFSTPGPAIHTGSTASSEISFHVVSSSDGNSTIHRASHRAMDGDYSEIISIDSQAISVDGNMGELRTATPYRESQADGVSTSALEDDLSHITFESDSFSDNTTVLDHCDEISDFEELNLNDNDS